MKDQAHSTALLAAARPVAGSFAHCLRHSRRASTNFRRSFRAILRTISTSHAELLESGANDRKETSRDVSSSHKTAFRRHVQRPTAAGKPWRKMKSVDNSLKPCHQFSRWWYYPAGHAAVISFTTRSIPARIGHRCGVGGQGSCIWTN
jgi:hypothetical protein